MDDLISRQAAIELIENESRKWGDEYGVSDVLCDLADLPAAQPEKRTNKSTKTHACDCVSRQAAIDLVEGLESARLKGEIDLLYPKVVKGLIGLPSAQPERKRGQWIEVDDAYNRIRGRCSACGWEAHMYEDDVVGMWFCPSCGADMRCEQDE